MDKSESWTDQDRVITRRREEVSILQIFWVNYDYVNLDKVMYLLNLMKSAGDNFSTEKLIRNVPWKVIAISYSGSLQFLFKSRWVRTLEIGEI